MTANEEAIVHQRFFCATWQRTDRTRKLWPKPWSLLRCVAYLALSFICRSSAARCRLSSSDPPAVEHVPFVWLRLQGDRFQVTSHVPPTDLYDWALVTNLGRWDKCHIACCEPLVCWKRRPWCAMLGVACGMAGGITWILKSHSAQKIHQ